MLDGCHGTGPCMMVSWNRTVHDGVMEQDRA